MHYLRLIKYPGSKSALIPDIQNTLEASGSSEFVDVFGGSGFVSLNAGAMETVYNDKNPELYNLFMVIHDHSNELQEIFRDFMDFVQAHSRKQRFEHFNRYINDNGMKALNTVLETGPVSFRPYGRQVGNAMKTILKFSTGFGGMGETYRTKKEKSVFRFLQKTYSSLGEISSLVSGWKVENMDFRDLVEKYDGRNAFFYFDPPYAGKKWYGDNFSLNDFSDLASLFDTIRGKYLMNIDSSQEFLLDIFGDPSFVKAYANQNASDGANAWRRRAFFTNVSR